jgi:O-antigen/teichoic acid export membrane protein
LIGRVQFGGYGIIQNTVGMFGVFAGMGLGLTATKYVAELRLADRDRAGRIIALTTAIALVTAATAATLLFAFARPLAAGILNAPYLSTELRIAAAGLFLNALCGAQTGVLAGFEAFRSIARVKLIQGLLAFPITVAAVLLWGLAGAVAGLAASAALGWALNHVAIRAECRLNEVPIRWEGFWAERSILWKFSVPTVLGGVMASPAMWGASALLANQPRGYLEMGLFSAANQWRTAVAFLPSLLAQPLLSMLSNMGSLENAASFRKLLRANLLLSFAFSASVAALVALCSSWIMKAYGRDFSAGKPVLILLVSAMVVSSTAAVIGQAIMSLGMTWRAYIINLLWAVTLFGAALLLVPRFGALGLAEAYLAACVANAVGAGIYAKVSFRERL